MERKTVEIQPVCHWRVRVQLKEGSGGEGSIFDHHSVCSTLARGQHCTMQALNNYFAKTMRFLEVEFLMVFTLFLIWFVFFF